MQTAVKIDIIWELRRQLNEPALHHYHNHYHNHYRQALGMPPLEKV